MFYPFSRATSSCAHHPQPLKVDSFLPWAAGRALHICLIIHMFAFNNALSLQFLQSWLVPGTVSNIPTRIWLQNLGRKLHQKPSAYIRYQLKRLQLVGPSRKALCPSYGKSSMVRYKDYSKLDVAGNKWNLRFHNATLSGM